MELFDIIDPAEQLLADKATNNFFALGGTMELTPLCNMNCRMCYIRQDKAQMDKQGKMLTCAQWLRIAEDMKRRGVLYLLLTGGEPLVYPEFEQLYTALVQMGFVLSVNTNATLIDEHWADLFGRYPCRRLSISLYGRDDETYGRICGNPQGFTQVMRAVQMLKARNIPFRFTCSVTPENSAQLPDIHRIARELGVHLDVANYMFPPVRKPNGSEAYARMTPEEAAASIYHNNQLRIPGELFMDAVRNSIAKASQGRDIRSMTGYTCRAGRSGFWINWKGELLPCGMMNEPKISLLEHEFLACWRHVIIESQKEKRCAPCDTCEKNEICHICMASMKAEPKDENGRPIYLCRMTDELIRLCRQAVQAAE